MSQQIKLNDKVGLNLPKLIASKLFVYANSGYGKSWLLRRILEQSFNKIQQIIIDPEGEFSTLREKYDYVLIGKGYDIAADPKTAGLLAHRLLQEKVSAIIDLYELEPDQRELFVANFTKALVNVPKNLHHPYLYVVDEAQDFAPEKGDALSSKAILSIAKKGRKRGCCPVFATQRVSDFSKSVIAACNNKIIGQASLDIDMKRCAAELGFTTKEQQQSLRDLDPGEFYIYGPAVSKAIQKIKVGPVFTTHPDASKVGSKMAVKVVPPSKKVLSALSKLADLPKEAQEEINTITGLKGQLSLAKREILDLKKAPKMATEMPAAMGVSQWMNYGKKYKYDEFFTNKIKQEVSKAWKLYSMKLRHVISDVMIAGEKASRIQMPAEPDEVDSKQFYSKSAASFEIPKQHYDPPLKLRDAQPTADSMPLEHITNTTPIEKLGACERKIYSFLCHNPDKSFSKVQLGAITGYAPKSGSFNNAISRLNAAGIIYREGGDVKLASRVPELESQILPDDEFSAEPSFWRGKLGAAENKIYETLWEHPEEIFSKESLGEATGYAPASGSFNNAISHLNSLGLIRRVKQGVHLNPEILDL